MACHELSQSAIPEGSCTEAFVKVSVEGADRQKSDGGERDWGGKEKQKTLCKANSLKNISPHGVNVKIKNSNLCKKKHSCKPEVLGGGGWGRSSKQKIPNPLPPITWSAPQY